MLPIHSSLRISDPTNWKTVYNIIQVENDGVWIALCHFFVCTTTEIYFVYYINNTTLRVNVDKVNFGIFYENQK